MNKYMRAIGFGVPPKRSQINKIIENGIRNPGYRAYTTDDDDEDAILAQYEIPLGDRFGISVCGQFDEKDHFYPEYYYPYLNSERVSTSAEPTVENRVDNDSFAGVCEDYRVGVTLIYRLRNSIEYIKNTHTNFQPLHGVETSLTALSLEGTVLLPIHKSAEEVQQQQEEREHKAILIRNAKNGNEAAAHELTAMDMDLYTDVMNHAHYEDIYTIVDSYLMPYGAECELYSLLGEIRKVERLCNSITEENVLLLTIDCNGLYMDVIIHEKDLMGEPAVGRRFRGSIWMQGKLVFPQGQQVL